MTGVPGLPPGYGAVFLDEVDSTNEEARRRAEAGGPDGTWIVAKRQTAGRGRRGRSWDTGAGNFAGTLLLRPQGEAAEVAQLSFVAALAVADMLSALGLSGIALKWPNDVLAGGEKIAGILLESASVAAGGAATGVGWLAVGIGVNLTSAPQGLPYPATCVAARGGPVPAPEKALEGLAAAWAHWYGVWAGAGFAPIREAWLARAAFLGQRARHRQGDDEIAGRFIDIDTTGALILETPLGRRTIASGEVVFDR